MKFLEKVERVLGIFESLIHEGRELIQGLQFVVNKLDELKAQLKIINLFMQAQGDEKVSITDIDAVVHKDGRIIEGFEQKSRQNTIYVNFISVNSS